MEKAKCIFEKVQRIVNGIIGLMLIAIMVIIFIIYTKYVIFYSIPWSEKPQDIFLSENDLLGINMEFLQKILWCR